MSQPMVIYQKLYEQNSVYEIYCYLDDSCSNQDRKSAGIVCQEEPVDKDVESLEDSASEESLSEGEESDGDENDSSFDHMRPLLVNYADDMDKSISEEG